MGVGRAAGYMAERRVCRAGVAASACRASYVFPFCPFFFTLLSFSASSSHLSSTIIPASRDYASSGADLFLPSSVRQLSDNSRFRTATNHAWNDCLKYLSAFPISRYTPREQRARTLLKWLHQGDEARQIAFFCDAEGRVVRGEEAWEWWFDERGGVKTVKDLERKVQRRMEEQKERRS
jgi:hypothetical protein